MGVCISSENSLEDWKIKSNGEDTAALSDWTEEKKTKTKKLN